MKAIARIGWLGLWLLVAPACGDDDGGTDGGASSDMGGDAGPMCIDPGQSCSFTSCCEGFCCCVAVGDGGSCAYTCVAERTGTCR